MTPTAQLLLDHLLAHTDGESPISVTVLVEIAEHFGLDVNRCDQCSEIAGLHRRDCPLGRCDTCGIACHCDQDYERSADK